MNRRLALHLAFWLAYWFIYAYTYSRYDGNLPKYLLTEGLQMPARMLATYAAMWCFEHFSTLSPSHTSHPLTPPTSPTSLTSLTSLTSNTSHPSSSSWLAFGGAALAVCAGGLLNRLLKISYVVPVYFPDSTIEFWSFRMMYDLFDVLVACCTALSARLYFRQQELQRREAALRIEKSEAELVALKSQLQPHFLFNTINNLYALARKKSDKTAPVALKLAHLLRYVLYESAKPTVRVEQEIQLLQDYIELEKLRFDTERLAVNLNIDLDDPQQPITPLLLLPLIENAFKHGVGETREQAWVNVSIVLKNNVLEAGIQNSKSTELPKNESGIGLKNLRCQLELLYPGRHGFIVNAGEATFSVYLRLVL
jgi:hypothetical protein